MQYFRDSATGAVFAFEDNVRVDRDAKNGALRFFVEDSDEPLKGPYPSTLEATNDPSPPPYSPTLIELQAERDTQLALASLRIAPLQDAIDLGDATPGEESKLLAWKQYRIALNRLDLTVTPVAWPEQPEAP